MKIIAFSLLIVLCSATSSYAQTRACYEKNPSFVLNQAIPSSACRAESPGNQSKLFYLGNTVYSNSTSSDVVVVCPVQLSATPNLVKIFISNSDATNATQDGRVKCTLATGTGRHSGNPVQVDYQLYSEKITTAGPGTKSVVWLVDGMQTFSTIKCTLPPSSGTRGTSYDPAGIAGIIAGKYDGTTYRCPNGRYGEPVITSSLPWDAVPGVTYPSILLD